MYCFVKGDNQSCIAKEGRQAAQVTHGVQLECKGFIGPTKFKVLEQQPPPDDEAKTLASTETSNFDIHPHSVHPAVIGKSTSTIPYCTLVFAPTRGKAPIFEMSQSLAKQCNEVKEYVISQPTLQKDSC